MFFFNASVFFIFSLFSKDCLALSKLSINDKEPGTIVQEIQKGFIMKGRLLRPSLVCVSKKTEKKAETSKKEEKNKEKKDKI